VLQQLNFGSFIGAQVSFWTCHDSSSLPTSPRSQVQVDCHSSKIKHFDTLAAPMLCSNTLITLETCHAAKFLDTSSLIPRMSHVLKLMAREPQKLSSYTSDAMEFEAASNGESLENPNAANMSLPSTINDEPLDAFDFFGHQHLPSNEKLTYFTPSVSNKVFPSINGFDAGDLQAPELLGQQ